MLFETISSAIKVLEDLKMRSVKELEEDSTLLGGVLWHLYLAVQGCIDMLSKPYRNYRLERLKVMLMHSQFLARRI